MHRMFPITTLLLAALPVAQAEIVDIRWSGDGHFVYQSSLAAGKFVELCSKLPAALKVGWNFESTTALDFNVHYHVGKDVVFPFKLSAVISAQDTLDTKIEQDYCWLWRNKSAEPATLTVKLQR